MANHCENVLCVRGECDELLRFDRLFRAGKEAIAQNYHLNNLYPTPELSICDIADWRKRYWGAKGNFYEYTFQVVWVSGDQTEVRFRFDTPWNPPEAWVQYVSGQFPALRFVLAYREEGNGISGDAAYSAGENTYDTGLSAEEIEAWFDEKSLEDM